MTDHEIIQRFCEVAGWQLTEQRIVSGIGAHVWWLAGIPDGEFTTSIQWDYGLPPHDGALRHIAAEAVTLLHERKPECHIGMAPTFLTVAHKVAGKWRTLHVEEFDGTTRSRSLAIIKAVTGVLK